MPKHSLDQLRRALLMALAAGMPCLIPHIAGAGPAEGSPHQTSLTLSEAIRTAWEHNAELKAGRSQIDAASGRAQQAATWPNPELELATEEWPPDHAFSEAKTTAGLTQTVPFPGKKKLDRSIGSAGVRKAEAELKLQEADLVRRIKTAFYRALAAEQITREQTNLVALAESFAHAARQRVEAGATADQEQLRAEIPLEQAKGELFLLEQDRVAAREALAALIGGSLSPATRLSGSLAESVQRPEQLPAAWQEHHPRLVLARSALAEAELAEKRAGLEPGPDVKLGLAGGREAGTGNSIVEFRVGLPLPLFDRSKGHKRESRAAVRIAEADLEQARRDLSAEWATAQARLKAATAQAALYRDRILPKAEAAWRLIQTGFDQGKFGFIDLLDTQRTVAEARLAYQKRLLDLNLAGVDLDYFSPAPSNPAVPQTAPSLTQP